VTHRSVRRIRGPRATGALLLSGLLAAAAHAGTPEPTPTPSLAARADRRWEGVVRRQKGLALAGRWRIGTLAFKEETFRWADARDPGRNLVLPAGQIVSHRRVCRNPAEAASCFEWSFRTKDGEGYVFREDGWSKGRNEKTTEVFVFFSAVLPDVPARTEAGTP